MFWTRNALAALTFVVFGVDTAAAMSCGQLKAELVTLERQRAIDQNALATCSASPGRCTIQFVRFFQQWELTIDAKEQLDKELLQINCPPEPRTPNSEEVTTYHYDMLRTGWNSHEKTLTPSIFSNFGRSHNIPVDERVSAQPLIIPGLWLYGAGIRDLVYVVTEANTVYGIDAETGAVLLTSNLGAPVPNPVPGGNPTCGDDGTSRGITSTPLIDTKNRALYVISWQWDTSDPANPKAVYRLYSLDLLTLNRLTAPVDIAAEHSLVGTTTPPTLIPPMFSLKPNSQFERQRSGLVAANGNIYAAFASFCDYDGDKSRGWLLGWDATTLEALGPNYLVNRVMTPPALSSIWMSGSGVASDREGNLYAVTGNSGLDYSHTTPCLPPSTYDNLDNLSESAIKVKGDLTRTLSSFTPQNHVLLDCSDLDFGSGGIMLLPDQPGSTPHLAVAAGKEGKMFLLNRDNMNSLGTYDIGQCFCVPSYFEGSDGVNRIVTSGGKTIQIIVGSDGVNRVVRSGASALKIWKVVTPSVGPPSLIEESSTPVKQDSVGNGFFTSVSSNSNDLSTTIIWAVTRTTRLSGPRMTLLAFDSKGRQIYESDFGSWDCPYVAHQFICNGLVHSVPVVSNGRVYVGGYRQLAIFEPGYGPTIPAHEPRVEMEMPVVGVVEAINGTMLTVREGDGTSLIVDAAKAINSYHSVPLSVGKSIAVDGELNDRGVLDAVSISHGESKSE